MATATNTAQPRSHAVPAVLRAPFEGRNWRELLYVLTGLPIACFSFAYSVTLVSASAGLLITFVGVPLLAAGLMGCRAIGRLERVRARGLLRLDVAEPGPVHVLQRRSGLLSWVGALLRSGVSWRHLLYTVVHFPWALFSFVLTAVFFPLGWSLALYPAWQWVFPRYLGEPGLQWGPDGLTAVGPATVGDTYLDNVPDMALTSAAGVGLVLLTPWLVRGLNHVDRLLVAGLLGPSRLATRVQELESDRGSVADTAAADLRRIERDLHDGAQARLVTLA
ncbi:Putative sensor, partial [Streptomyces sp. WMMB 714]|uniref:sensor histidine kinase n=1 Tax=Streptomyces sp. WMMB 714 TaxID=1286822 RepID=UPI0005F7DDEA